MSIILKLHWSILVLYLGLYLTELLINLKHINYSPKIQGQTASAPTKNSVPCRQIRGYSVSKKTFVFMTCLKWFSQKYDNLNHEKVEIINRRETIHHRNRVMNQFF